MTYFQRNWLFVNMPFTEDDKILIKNLFELKGCNTRHLVRVFQKKQKCLQHLQVVANTKMASREIITICMLYLII